MLSFAVVDFLSVIVILKLIFIAGVQVSLLKKRVNIGSGTPSRIKKLIDIEALGLSRLDMIVLDMDTDVKGFSLFTLPQVRFVSPALYSHHQLQLHFNF